MIRKAFIVVLLLAALGAGLLWVESYRKGTTLDGRGFPGWCTDWKLSRDTGVHMIVRGGGICFSYRCPVSPSQVGPERGFGLTGNLGYIEYPYGTYKPCPLKVEHHFVEPKGKRLVLHTVCLPLSLLLILFAGYPVLAFIRGPLRRYRRRRKGLCIKCAYDLTGNVSGVCPECGTEVKEP